MFYLENFRLKVDPGAHQIALENYLIKVYQKSFIHWIIFIKLLNVLLEPLTNILNLSYFFNFDVIFDLQNGMHYSCSFSSTISKVFWKNFFVNLEGDEPHLVWQFLNENVMFYLIVIWQVSTFTSSITPPTPAMVVAVAGSETTRVFHRSGSSSSVQQPYSPTYQTSVWGTWRIWSNINSIWVHFSTTIKLHKSIKITLVMCLYVYI